MTGHSRDTPGQTHDATNHRTALHLILHQGNLRPVLRAEQMPEDNAALAEIAVEFAPLPENSAGSCPVSINELLRYLADEVPDGDALTEADLRFLRTADVEATRYWIWSFDEPDGDPAYVTVSVSPRGATTLCYDTNYYRLTPEQFILGDYHRVF